MTQHGEIVGVLLAAAEARHVAQTVFGDVEEVGA